MFSLARSLLALACFALLQGACTAWLGQHPQPSRRGVVLGNVILGNIAGSDIVTLPVIHIGIPDAIVGLPNNCDPYGFSHKILRGSMVIVINSGDGPHPDIIPVDPDDPQSNLAVHCQEEVDDDGNVSRCPAGFEIVSYQFCRQLHGA